MPVNVSIELDTIEDILKVFDASPRAFKQAAYDAAIKLRQLVRGRTPIGDKANPGYTDGRQPGEMKASWSDVQLNGTKFMFNTSTVYSLVLEEGLYKNIGPRTVQYGTGIFSRQAPGGMMEPVVDNDENLIQIATLVVAQILRVLDETA